MMSFPVPGRTLLQPTAAAVLLVAAVSPLAAAVPKLSEAEAIEKIAAYKDPLEGKTIASFPAAVSSSEQPLDSMGALAIGESCFASWKKMLTALVARGYLSGYRQSETELAIEERHVTASGRLYFGAVLPRRYHSQVRIVPALEEARLEITRIGPGSRATIVEFESTPCEVFQILWKHGVLSSECHGSVHESVVLADGKVRGHAHFKYRNGGWTIIKVELGPHGEDE